MRSRSMRAVALTIAACALTACGGEPAAHPDVTAAASTVRLVDREEADLVLSVSNQSLEDESVRLTVAVDGVTVVDGDFRVEGQHHWVTFPIGLSPGGHTLTAASGTGATVEKSFEVPGDDARFAVLDYVTEGDSQRFAWSFSAEPPAFA